MKTKNIKLKGLVTEEEHIKWVDRMSERLVNLDLDQYRLLIGL